ncbi:MAG TPA: glycosyltransferase family 2 protein [Rhodanobacteraceae bacterium]|nr:glycosyltransferase family 2 protein [Rhodanobacteraceae bacterium]
MSAQRQLVTAVVTTLDNAATLPRCLASVEWADELLVLDSGSTDTSCEIALAHGARIETQAFLGYARQKQHAIDLARHDWILLLDADECLVAGAREAIEQALRTPRVGGFRLPRREQMFWRFPAPGSQVNTHLRLFDRRRAGMNQVPIHAAVELHQGHAPVLRRAVLDHYGEPDIHTKVEKINRYSSGLVEHKLKKRSRFVGLRMVLYPPLFFLRQYLFKRYFLNGWAGFIASAIGAQYVFLKYAKLHEARRQRR